ncbi:hypothetical protein [Eisenibacter elegans]|nr:hypothetical protein [Eisenibacter elegans]
MYGRKGSLFIPNFSRKAITDDQYFTPRPVPLSVGVNYGCLRRD